MADHYLTTKNIRLNGNVYATVIAPIEDLRAKKYACMTKEKFPKLGPNVPKNLDWESAVYDILRTFFPKEMPYGENTFVKKVGSVKPKGKDSLEISCVLAKVDVTKADVPMNLDFRTTGDGGRYSVTGFNVK